jgi:hypothetical protein
MKTKQRGTTIIEVLGATAVGSLMLFGLSAMIDSSLEDTKGQQAALHQARVAEAARKYINSEYKSLKDATSTPDVLVTISVTDIINKKFLPAGFSLTNAYGQKTCIVVRQPSSGTGKLEALVVTSGGLPIDDRNIRIVAANAGEGGGYIAVSAPTTAQGASWTLSTSAYKDVKCNNTGPSIISGNATDAGHLVSHLFFDGPGFNDFLYRFEVDGRPDLNKMHTPLRFTTNAIVTEGAACGTHAAIASDSARNLLRCGTNGLWTEMTSWKDPVANYSAFARLPVNQKAVGDVRMALAEKRAFMYDGSSWVALAVDQFGNLDVPRDVIAGRNVTAGNDVIAQYEVTAGRDIYGRNISATGNITAGQDITAGDHLKANTIHSDWWVEATHFEPTQRRWPRDPCMVPSSAGYRWTLGSIVRDGNGRIMSCQLIGGDYVFAYMDGSFYP